MNDRALQHVVVLNLTPFASTETMMVPFDTPGGPPQGNAPPQPMQRPPMPMPPHHPHHPHHPQHPHAHPMNAPPPHAYARTQSQQGMPPYGQSMPSPAQRPNNFNMPNNAPGYSSHPPLHSPHQGGPPPPYGIQRKSSLGGSGRGVAMMGSTSTSSAHEDAMRSSSSAGAHQRHYPQQQQGAQQGASAGMIKSSWQSDKDTPHRRDMIHHM